MDNTLINLFDSTVLFKITEPVTNTFQVKGENRKGLVLLCQSISNALSTDEQEMLGKMLTALKLTWDDVALICTTEDYPFAFLKRNLFFKKLVSFGFTPAQLGVNINANNYQLIPFNDTKIIFSEPLSGLKENRDNSKDHFWRAMKEMFVSE